MIRRTAPNFFKISSLAPKAFSEKPSSRTFLRGFFACSIICVPFWFRYKWNYNLTIRDRRINEFDLSSSSSPSSTATHLHTLQNNLQNVLQLEEDRPGETRETFEDRTGFDARLTLARNTLHTVNKIVANVKNDHNTLTHDELEICWRSLWISSKWLVTHAQFYYVVVAISLFRSLQQCAREGSWKLSKTAAAEQKAQAESLKEAVVDPLSVPACYLTRNTRFFQGLLEQLYPEVNPSLQVNDDADGVLEVKLQVLRDTVEHLNILKKGTCGDVVARAIDGDSDDTTVDHGSRVIFDKYGLPRCEVFRLDSCLLRDLSSHKELSANSKERLKEFWIEHRCVPTASEFRERLDAQSIQRISSGGGGDAAADELRCTLFEPTVLVICRGSQLSWSSKLKCMRLWIYANLLGWAIRPGVDNATMEKAYGISQGTCFTGHHDLFDELRGKVMKRIDKARGDETRCEHLYIGHSLGASVAQLLALAVIHEKVPMSDVSVFSVGAPPIFDQDSAEEVDKKFPHYRFWCVADVSPTGPINKFPWRGWHHSGRHGIPIRSSFSFPLLSDVFLHLSNSYFNALDPDFGAPFSCPLEIKENLQSKFPK